MRQPSFFSKSLSKNFAQAFSKGLKLENRKRESQIATVVADVTYTRYRSSCPNCGKVEYPLDVMLGLRSLQRLSWLMEELSILCGASWKYGEAEYILEKFLGRRVSHETIFNNKSFANGVKQRWEASS